MGEEGRLGSNYYLLSVPKRVVQEVVQEVQSPLVKVAVRLKTNTTVEAEVPH